MATVNRNMFEASIMADQPHGTSLMVLPLNLIALIISYVDNTGDLARLCQTCRVLNYMALPQLYKNLTLTSYDKIRYVGDQPEGMGSASPFSMGLNAVLTRPYASLVRSLTLRGDWREHDLEEHARVGRVPDSSMMLNIAVRAAIDRMTGLESFSWELNTKMLETVYLGLAQLPKLTALTVRFPSSRHPRPITVIPPMPHLRYLKITDIDPLCYPDDISTLLWKSRKLRELKMHWSPRMRNAQEPSVMLNNYFRKCIAAKQPIPIRKLSLQNLYAFHSEEFNLAFDHRTMADVTILHDGALDSAMNNFVDYSWPVAPPNLDLRIKSVRQDVVSKRHADFLGHFTGLERLYFVNTPRDPNNIVETPGQSTALPLTASTLTPPSMEQTYSNHTASNSPSASPAGCPPSSQEYYLTNIMSNHCATLRHLLFPSRWPLSATTIARLVRVSPNLEQIGFATELSSMDTLVLLLPFLKKLSAIRLLVPTARSPNSTGSGPVPHVPKLVLQPNGQAALAAARTLADIVDIDDDILEEKMSVSLADKEMFGNLRIVGMGRKAWELREFYTVPQPTIAEQESRSQSPIVPNPVVVAEVNGHSQGLGVDTRHGWSSPQIEQNGTSHTRPSLGRPSQQRPQPPSLLGKRHRDDEPSSPTSERQNGPENLLTGDCTRPSPAGEGHVWRRRLRRVGWDVLRHWEIWGLDTQEM